ncbi:hypothetical protein PIB30_039899 [Stylosanthes scabra]|uniref:Uncharacterized protein n=1 Tax=Stylosanthes scabra TaxID=79078 RepID=A0ABU6ZD48_9FABA|nr:hypothetical protein [Stylosanthes scabra]
MKSHNKIDNVTLKHMGRNPDYNQDQAIVVQRQPRPRPLPTMRDVLEELHSQILYIEGKFVEMSKVQDEIRQDQKRQRENAFVCEVALGAGHVFVEHYATMAAASVVGFESLIPRRRGQNI